MPHLDLSDEETAALSQELHDIVEGDRYPFSPRIRRLRGAWGCFAEHLVFDFNLCSAAFVRFAFMSHDTFPPGGMPPMILAGLKRGPKRMHVFYRMNDLKSLTIFHQRVIEQCYEKVYCSKITPYGVTVLPPA